MLDAYIIWIPQNDYFNAYFYLIIPKFYAMKTIGIVIELRSKQDVGKSCSYPLLLQNRKDFSYALYTLSGVCTTSKLEGRNFLEMYSHAALWASPGMSAVSKCFPFHDVLQKVQKSYCQGFGKHVWGFNHIDINKIALCDPGWLVIWTVTPPMELGPCHYILFSIYAYITLYHISMCYLSSEPKTFCVRGFQEWRASG